MHSFRTSWYSVLGAGFAASVLWAASAQAAPIISFDQTAPIAGGTVSYDGEGGALIGTGIPFDRVGGLDTPVNAGATSLCLGCVLNFTTGPNVTEGAIYTWAGAPLGSFTLTGSLPFLPAPGPILGPTVLLSGTISTARLDTDLLIVGLRGVDFKHPTLVDFYFGPGPDPIFSFVNTQIVIGGINFDPTGNGGFTAAVTNADIDNVIPEPATALLFLLGLGSLAAYRRKN